LIFSTDKGFVALLRRDDCRVDSKKLKKLIGAKSLRIATPEELKRETGFEVGMVSPILLPQSLPVFIDRQVLAKATVRVGTGGNDFSLEISTVDLQKITAAEAIDVCELNAGLSSKQRVLSGITPSSSKGLHLGNFLGAVKPHVELQQVGECYYFIADYHALNTVQDPQAFANNVFGTYLDYLALGIDVQKTTFFVESHVRSIFELTEILNNVVTVAHMQKMHAFKDKLADPDASFENINMGLFTYPILMSADILIFEPDIVPVGEDQAQHVEVARDIAKSFNHRYGEVLKIPELYIKKEVARVIGTDGVRKMSKSLGNDITIFADEATVTQQIMGITTDPSRIRKDDPGDPAKNVIFSYMQLMGYDSQKIAEFSERYRLGTIGDVELKKEFLRFFLAYFADFRTKRAELAKDRDAVSSMIRAGSEKANLLAEQTINKIRKAIGAIN
jgi:tryptophanyl-tRNA synthetase